MCGGLLAAAVAVAAAGVGLHAARGLAFGGLAGGAWDVARVAGAAAGNVETNAERGAGTAHGATGIGPSGRRAVSSTFAPVGGGAGRDASPGIGRLELRNPDRRVTTLTVRQLLARGSAGTYMPELLQRRDSALIRWPERPDRPLAVYVASGSAVPGWHAQFVSEVASAFTVWTRAGVPLRFAFVDDPARADVRVAWIDRFAEPISGRTVWARDDRWWLVDANITLALHHADGAPLDGEQVRAIAMHEVGHLLGLDHTADPNNIMAPRVRVRELSAADEATVRLLYSVPAGRVQ